MIKHHDRPNAPIQYDNRTNLGLRILSLVILAGTALAWWLMPRLLEAAYAGTAGPLLSGLIGGRDIHPLEFYAEQLRLLLILATLVAVPAGLLIGSSSFERARARIGTGITAVAAAAPLLLALLAGSWLLLRITGSLQLPLFGDAAEKVVAAWMLSTGGRLYADIYANHGPLSYLLAHTVYMLSGATEMAPYRLAQWALIILTVAALGASHALGSRRQRLLAMALLTFIIATLYPTWKAHEPLYSINAGLFFSIALSLWLLPLLLGRPNSASAVAIGAAMLPCMVALGYPFAVPLALFIAGVILVLYGRGQLRAQLASMARPILIGIAGAALLLLGWLLAFADLLGYVAYHLYLNQVHYAAITRFNALHGLGQLTHLMDPRLGWALLAVLLLPFWLRRAAHRPLGKQSSRRRRIATTCGMLLLIVGMLYLNPRGDEGFKVASLQVPAAALLAIMLARWLAPMGGSKPGQRERAGLIGVLLAMILSISVVGFTPFAGPLSESSLLQRRQLAQAEQAAARPLIEHIDARLDPGEPIQVLTFLPRWYLLANRLPAAGQYYYLPAQADYERAPMWGHERERMNLCVNLAERRVEVVLLHDYPIHGIYRLQDYAPCVARLLETDYNPAYFPSPQADIPMPLLLIRKPQ